LVIDTYHVRGYFAIGGGVVDYTDDMSGVENY